MEKEPVWLLPRGLRTHHLQVFATILLNTDWKKIKITAIYAHTAERHWETDTDVMHLHGDIRECEDIAHQLVFRETGQELNVILGRSPCNPKKNVI